MAVRSRFAPRVPQAPTGRKLSSQIVKDMRGLNSTDPYGILPQSASPYLRNARMYLSTTERQVAISTRTGAREYTIPIGEGVEASETSTDNADEVTASQTTWIGQMFSPSTTGVLTKVDINVKKGDGSAPLSIRVYTDNSGEPGDLIARSTILNPFIDDSFAYSEARFVEAPLLESTEDYWLVFSVQKAGSDNDTYILSTTDNSTDASISVSSGNEWTAENYSLNFRAYLSENSGVLGSVRYYPQSSSPVTFFAHQTDIYEVDDSDGSTTSVKSGLNAGTSVVRFAQFAGDMFAVNGLDPLQRYSGGAFSNVAEAPGVPGLICEHKAILFIVDASDRNKISFTNPAEFDYTDWETTDFIYIPETKSADPITGLVSFQDNLIVFTKNDKWVLYGSDLATFEPRQALGQKGAVSQEAIVVDDNYIYFVSDDGHMYRWNGSKDEQLSRVIEANLDDVATFENVRLTLANDRIHYWFQSTGQPAFDNSFVYETRYDEWFYDTGRYINGGFTLTQENDQVIFSSGQAGVLYWGSSNYSDLGKPIEFEYYTNYFDFGVPDNLKQVRRLYTQFRKIDNPGLVIIGVDVDFKNDPVEEEIQLQSSGYRWGDSLIEWGDSEIFWGSNDQYQRQRMTVPGQATHYQVRISKTCTEAPVFFIGHSEYYRNRRPA